MAPLHHHPDGLAGIECGYVVEKIISPARKRAKTVVKSVRFCEEERNEVIALAHINDMPHDEIKAL